MLSMKSRTVPHLPDTLEDSVVEVGNIILNERHAQLSYDVYKFRGL